MLVSGGLNFAGTVVRILPWPFVDPQNAGSAFGFLMFGQTLCAVGVESG